MKHKKPFVPQDNSAPRFGYDANGSRYFDRVHVHPRDEFHARLEEKHADLSVREKAEQRELCGDVAKYGRLSRLIELVEDGIDVNCLHDKTFAARAFKYCGKSGYSDYKETRFGEADSPQRLDAQARDLLLVKMLKIYLVAGAAVEPLQYEPYVYETFSYKGFHYLKDIYEGREPFPTRESLEAEGIHVDWAKRDYRIAGHHPATTVVPTNQVREVHPPAHLISASEGRGV